MDVKPKTKMSNSRFGHQLSVKDLLESAGGLTFRKTFTPSVPHVSTLPTDSTSSSTTFGSSKTTDGEKATIFSRLCELFGKEAQYMHEVYKSDNPASAAADVLGYSYEAPTKNTRKKEQAKQAKPEKQQVTPPPPPLPPLKIKPIEVQDVKNKVVEQKAPVTDERQVVRDRLMKDLKEKIAQRRIEIKMQRQELFKNPMGIDLSLEEEDQGQNDLWTAIPALADPDNLDSSFETEEHHSQSGAEPSFRGEMEGNREWPFATEMCIQMEVSDASSQPPSSPSEGSEFHTVDLNRSADSRLPLQIGGPWDPDAAFSEVERILASLERNGDSSVHGTALEPHYDTPRAHTITYLRDDPRSDEDRHSDDSGMSSADTSNSGREEPKSLLYSIVSSKPQTKPVRKTKQQQQQQVATIPTEDSPEPTGDACRNDPKVEVGWPTQMETSNKLTSEISHHLHDSHIYSIAHDSPIIIDTLDYGGDDDSERRIRIDLRPETPSIPAAKIATAAALGLVEDDNYTYRTDSETYSRGQLRNRCETLTNSAGEIFGSLRSNLSTTVSTTHEALHRITANVGNAVRPIADTISEASYELINELNRATEPIVQHLQLLSTRLQVRYIHAAQQNQWLPRIVLIRDASDWVEDIPKSQNGFEDLRLHVKEGGDLCKELSAILQERSELEASYAKGLAKLASKLLKTTSDLQGPHGTVTSAWASAATVMDSEAELHKALSVSLSEELVKPLKLLVESQHRVRKTVESGVDKTGRVLAEWRSAQGKAKKQCYMTARDNEKMQDHIYNDARLGKPRVLTDKETAKLEAKCKKTEEAVRKAEGEYYTCCVRAERSRMEWESATQRGSRCFHALEHERLSHLKDLVSKYHVCLREYGPKLCQSVERLTEPVTSCNVDADLQRVSTLRESAPPYAEQLLPDFYAEHMSNVINRERRKDSLERCLHWVRSDVEREARGKRGVENLARALQDTPTFGGEESQLEVCEKLHHLKSMLAFLEMTKVKLHNALCELEPSRIQKVDHPLFKYLEVHKDKQGMMQSVLKLPHWIENEEIEIEYPEDRGAADGTSGMPDSDFDEFSSQDSDGDCSSHSVIQCSPNSSTNSNSNAKKNTTSSAAPGSSTAPSVGKCRALYSYSANMYDELSIQPGDMINIHDKQPDGWWLGELDGTVGIFPATYVEEI